MADERPTVELVELRVPLEAVELAADRLWAAGAGGVEERVFDERTVSCRAVLTGVDSDRSSAVERVGVLPPGWSLHWVEAPDAPDEAWRDHVAAIDIGGADGFVIRPAWSPPLRDGRVEIEIEPAASFGLGDHPTTRLCASAVRSLVRPGSKVLDVGCGSGVLGIVALRFGAEQVRAVDVSAAAVEATRSNCERNGVGGRVDVSLTPLAEVDGRFELVVANILAPTLIDLADDLVRLLAFDGVLIVSGLLASAHDHVVEALRPLRVARRTEMSSWCALELRR